MNARNLLYCVLAALLCFSAVFLADRLPAQNKGGSGWRYKTVDLNLELLVGRDGKLADPIGFDLDADKIQGRLEERKGRLEELLDKYGAGGWELVSYSGGTAVYKRRTE